MFILLLAYAITQSVYGDAGPIQVSIQSRDVASCDGLNRQRYMRSMVWSCLFTIFLCTWVAIHPNVHFRPEKRDQKWFERWLWDPLHDFIKYKLLLFLWALLVPEYILAWAVRQYAQAGAISKQVPEWTRTHGFFLVMGGFHLFRLPADIPVCPLKFTDFPVDILEIIAPTETELRDKGKSDAVTKLIVLIQTLWFVVQCIARGTQNLPLTELEVVTLAYAMLNFFIYVFWWDKPRNVGCPIRVYKTSVTTHEESGEKADKWDDNWTTHTSRPILTKRSHPTPPTFRVHPYASPSPSHRTLALPSSVPLDIHPPNPNFNISTIPFLKRKQKSPRHPRQGPTHPTQFPLRRHRHPLPIRKGYPRLHRLVHGRARPVCAFRDRFVTVSERHSIPMFWSGRMADRDLGLAGLGPSVLGAAFGAIHCIAWSSEFPSRAELALWRISCVSMIVVPFAVALVCAGWTGGRREGAWYMTLLTFIVIISTILLGLSAWLYIASRIATLVIAFTSLRSLPPAALVTVDWTTFIPHI
ncbi:hypothetical protein M408DRAFT_81236 [Serendipita vermifera MAFF 305830]|uniref:Uncharacterized protein n=1 Tax=Serendipita vermifera MAFF 305830 TaxID=933852 RepID=A0A0C3A8J2_SERVB|nr:hypothetical protein M408DRAFT_81236 [Serendipita vermifera MAFF 305830]